MTDPSTAQAWVRRLTDLGRGVRDAIVCARAGGAAMATAVAQEGGDTIFAIDRHVEPVIEQHCEDWPEACRPLMLIAEGMGEDGRLRFGEGEPRWWLIIDPIDGTRNIMYDKRAAWFLAAVAEAPPGREPTLRDAIASVMVEMPTSKAGFGDMFAACRTAPEAEAAATASRESLSDGGSAQLAIAPSSAGDLRHGFAQVSNFFPGTKVLAAELMERIIQETLGGVEPGGADVFDDQYITTGGQLVELIVGHDRFCCDLRPLFYQAIENATGRTVRGLECHPYDMAGLLIAEAAGVVVTDGFGRPLDANMTVEDPVHWCGYANQTLRRRIEPVVQAWLKDKGVQPAS